MHCSASDDWRPLNWVGLTTTSLPCPNDDTSTGILHAAGTRICRSSGRVRLAHPMNCVEANRDAVPGLDRRDRDGELDHLLRKLTALFFVHIIRAWVWRY